MRRVCLLCRRNSWQGSLGDGTCNKGIHDRPCKCGGRHRVCFECWDRHRRLIGTFPDWKEALTVCPRTDPRPPPLQANESGETGHEKVQKA